MMIEDDAEDVVVAQEEAEDVLYLAILKFVAMNNNGQNNLFRLLGLEIALLRAAARIALVQEEHGAQNTKPVFVKLAREQFAQVLKVRTSKQRPESRPKPSLKVVE